MNELELGRFMAKVAPDGECWRWTGAIKTREWGYGSVWVGKRTMLAHRAAYEHYVGPIPEGLTLDHLCRNRWCVRPEHLEAVTNRINGLRGGTVQARNAAKTHCPRGHEYTPENTYISRRSYGVFRSCRTCKLKRQAQRLTYPAFKARRREQGRRAEARYREKRRQQELVSS